MVFCLCNIANVCYITSNKDVFLLGFEYDGITCSLFQREVLDAGMVQPRLTPVDSSIYLSSCSLAVNEVGCQCAAVCTSV